ncbi:Enoyl-(Acyl carrier protein) reductase [Ceratobasidium sp. AG-Ba]|nr:Enoyl-(Acyl carrier protein) reductase [Ceratobasidium sp. AG-Ba]
MSKILPVICDVTKESQVEALVQTAVTELGGIDVTPEANLEPDFYLQMVANAGIFRPGSLLNVSDEDFDEVHAVNVKGVLYSYRAAARAMIARGTGGRIIGACSRAGKYGAPETGAYTATREWGKFGITVNAYAAGPVDTEMWNVNVDKLQAFRGLVASAPTGRITSPEEVAGLVTFLISPAAKNITGQAISMDGGLVMN